HSAPGFVTSGSKALGTALEITNLPAETPSRELLSMVAAVEDSWQHPCGDVLSHGIEIHAALTELSAGFYYNRVWPDHPLTEQAKEHWQRGQEYYSELRQFFRSTQLPREGLDTPLVVGKWHESKGPVPGWDGLYRLWQRWREVYRDDLPDRLSVPVWVDDYKIRHAVKWAKKIKRGGNLWCH